MIKLNHLVCGYHHEIKVNEVNLAFLKGKVTIIIGPNGCGKSTLLKTTAGLLPAIKGKVELYEKPLDTYTPKQVAKWVSYLPQIRSIPSIQVQSLIAHGRFPHLGFSRQMSQEDRDFVELGIKSIQLESYRDCNLQELSGGEQQKAYFGMSIAQNSEILLLDEPTTYLDIQHQFSLLESVKTYSKQGKTIIMVIHDLAQALRYADQVILMDQKNVIFHGNVKDTVSSGLIEKVFHVQLKKIIDQNEEIYLITSRSNKSISE